MVDTRGEESCQTEERGWLASGNVTCAVAEAKSRVWEFGEQIWKHHYKLNIHGIKNCKETYNVPFIMKVNNFQY